MEVGDVFTVRVYEVRKVFIEIIFRSLWMTMGALHQRSYSDAFLVALPVAYQPHAY